MKRKSDIKDELDKAWEIYNASIEKFANSECKDVEAYKLGIRAFGRIEALNWVIDNSTSYMRDLGQDSKAV